ncbi:hypothetical protein HPB52_024534 [Rhipicephalus sanguineus]|uniref:Uncharacterized protein n=1 Tax=Rhipicephalus sanguineus TaxID=34632 RepID=A0A9D4TE77_RHISA|nr:hypothetical protein HPB52_024534 [Rhipicephalus sanguineus]
MRSEYQGSSDAYSAVFVGALTGATKTAASVRGLEKRTCCVSRTAVKNYGKDRVRSKVARIIRKVEDIESRGAVVIKWFLVHMGSDVSERRNANHNETANAAALGLTNHAAANTADSECWSRYSVKDKMTTFNEIVKWYRLK